MRFLAALAVAAVAVPAFAQTLSIGYDFQTRPSAGDAVVAATQTNVSLIPASATGTVATVRFYSSSFCTNGVKIKFFRRSGDTITMTTERGPFTTDAGSKTFTMTPAVPVQQGDLIGYTRLSGDCGHGTGLFEVVNEGYLAFAGDVSGSVDVGAAGAHDRYPLALHGIGTATESIARIIPAVASAPGAAGANFKTSMQLLNPTQETLTGRLVFHPAGTHDHPSDDATLAYSLPPRTVDVFEDAVAAMNRSGLGSIDVVVPEGQFVPLIVTRVYNDGGTRGTSGFTEDALNPVFFSVGSRILATGASGFIVTPPDFQRYRLNIGVRTLSSGAELEAILRDRDGNIVSVVGKIYPPNYFEQLGAEEFFGAAIGDNGSIQITVTSGSAIVYGSSTDNVTNDPSVQFVESLFSSF